jgi:chemotaxis protein MotB
MSADGGAEHGGGGGGHEEEEDHGNHEAWVIPYADMLTLLMALFLMLYAIGQLDLKKFGQLAEGLNTTLGGGTAVVQPLEGGANGALDGGTAVVESMAGGIPQASAGSVGAAGASATTSGPSRAEARALIGVEASIMKAAERGGFADQLEVDRDERGLIITFGADRLLFAPGSDQLGTTGRSALDAFAAAVADLPNPLTVEGHTDSTPISTSRFPSNWELSTARATAVLRYLTTAGVPAGRLSAAGYADLRPRVDGTSAEARQANRRVELIIHAPTEADVPESLVVNPGLSPVGP